MSSFDYESKQGDTGNALNDTLTYSDGSPVDLTGATLTFVARNLTATQPLTLTGTVTSPVPTTGAISYTPAGDDTQTPGLYQTNWVVVLAGGATMTFPTEGYNSWSIEKNLTASSNQQLVGLPDLKDYINIPADDKSHDAKLVRYIEAVRPLVENICGPIIPQEFDEWYDGGQYFIQLRHRPTSGYGTSPLITIVGCDEYRGPIKYPLSIVGDPSEASIYSVMLDPRIGTLYRRTTGGGLIQFGAGAWGGALPSAVHVIYQAGQRNIPANVYEGTLELIRVNYRSTQSVGRGRQAPTDASDVGQPLGFYVPRRVRELLAPTRRHPSVA